MLCVCTPKAFISKKSDPQLIQKQCPEIRNQLNDLDFLPFL